MRFLSASLADSGEFRVWAFRHDVVNTAGDALLLADRFEAETPRRLAVGVANCVLWASAGVGRRLAAPLADVECLAVEADGVLYSPAASLHSLSTFLESLVEFGRGALPCRHLWPPFIAEGRRPVRLIHRWPYGVVAGGLVKVLEYPEGYPARYASTVLKLYGVAGEGLITTPSRAPGRGLHIGEEYGVYLDGLVKMESPWGLDFALNVVLGTVGDKWILMGRDGLYEAVFVKTGGAKGEVGYVKVTSPYEGDVRLVEGPSYCNFELCGDVARWPLDSGGVCLSAAPDVSVEAVEEWAVLLPPDFLPEGLRPPRASPLLFSDDYVYLFTSTEERHRLRAYRLTRGYIALAAPAAGAKWRIPLKPPYGGARISKGGVDSYALYRWLDASVLYKYYEPLASAYGAVGGGFFDRIAIPGGGLDAGAEFEVYLGDFLLLKSPRGVDLALNVVLGDKWILMGRDGLYEAVFKREGGAGGKVGYVKVVGPYGGDVGLVEGPPALGEFLPSECGYWSPLTGRCYADPRLDVVKKWPLETVDASEYLHLLEEILAPR
ncbi:MAG: hypothetical protein QXK63_00610 [Thermoproteus sp.]